MSKTAREVLSSKVKGKNKKIPPVKQQEKNPADATKLKDLIKKKKRKDKTDRTQKPIVREDEKELTDLFQLQERMEEDELVNGEVFSPMLDKIEFGRWDDIVCKVYKQCKKDDETNAVKVLRQNNNIVCLNDI